MPEEKPPTARHADLAAAVFGTTDGKEFLAHLEQRFDLEGRTFIPGPDRTVCPLRAAIRDGERAAVRYIKLLIQTANHDRPIDRKPKRKNARTKKESS